MTAAKVDRSSISVEETTEYEDEGVSTVAPFPARVTWEARLNGRLTTGEHVEMSRINTTFASALSDLETAIAGNGWGIR